MGHMRAWQKHSHRARIWPKPFSRQSRLWHNCPRKIGTGLSNQSRLFDLSFRRPTEGATLTGLRAIVKACAPRSSGILAAKRDQEKILELMIEKRKPGNSQGL